MKYLGFLILNLKLNIRLGRWVEYIQTYTHILKYKWGTENRVLDASGWNINLIKVLTPKVIGLGRIKKVYTFGSIFTAIKYRSSLEYEDYMIQDRYLYI